MTAFALFQRDMGRSVGRYVRRVGLIALAGAGLLLSAGLPAGAYELKPFKDKLFRYPRLIEVTDGGTFERVEYVRDRDLVRRDDVLRIQVQPHYVNKRPTRRQKTLTYTVNGQTNKYIGLGRLDGGARAIVIYVHGAGGDRFVGANDWSYGGNFNRIKNLMLRNDGVYLSPDFTDFRTQGKAEIRALVKRYAALSPGAPVFLACTSMGGTICWSLVQDAQVRPLLGGLLFFGGFVNNGFLESAAFRSARRPVPIYMGHGTKDTIYSWEAQARFFRAMRARRSDYPLRFALFETGSHGTPVRMTDWRRILNWMLSLRS